MSDSAIKFCFRLGHNATETFAKLQQACGDSVLSRAQVFRWFKAFLEGRESIEESPQGTSFWDTGKHSNDCNRPAEGYSNIRAPPVLRSGRNVSSAVWLQKAVTLKETMLNCKFIGINK
ncbi:HTH_48 domain-containing protein [Trichonephila clavipes]|nr:HTH_48 domain-containing protein [Trichonephila clavipes]